MSKKQIHQVAIFVGVWSFLIFYIGVAYGEFTHNCPKCNIDNGCYYNGAYTTSGKLYDKMTEFDQDTSKLLY